MAAISFKGRTFSTRHDPAKRSLVSRVGIARLSEFDQKLGNTRIHNGIVNLSCTWQTGQHENQKAQLPPPSLSF